MDASSPGPLNVLPAKYCRIEMWDYDETSLNDQLAVTETNQDGYFELGPVDPYEPLQGTQDVFLVMFAQNSAATVCSRISDGTYYLSSPIVDEMGVGVFDTIIVIGGGLASGPARYFFAADKLLDASTWWNSNGGLLPARATLEVRDAGGDSTSFYSPSQNFIHIESFHYTGEAYDSDSFDEDVIIHEYGHYLEHAFSFADDGGGAEHDWYEILDQRLAFAEGFASWLACSASGLPFLEDTYNDNLDTAWFDLEDGTTGTEQGVDPLGTATHRGKQSEAAMAGLFWDIDDYAQDDYARFFDNLDSLYFHRGYEPDGYGDTLDESTWKIVSSLVTRSYGGQHPDRVAQFWMTWSANPTYGHPKAMKDIWLEHGVCCTGVTGDLNYSGNIDLKDLSILVAYLTPPSEVTLPCKDEANVNAIGGVDLSDLSLLTAYLSQSPRPTLPICP